MYYIDSHSHLTDDRLFVNLEEIINESNAAGVKFILSISDDVTIFEKNKQISDTYENVFWTVGVHPHYAEKKQNDLKENIKKYLYHKKVIGFGEIGLDYYYGKEKKNEQILLLEEQLDIAKKTNLPLIIHSRESDADMFDILKNNSIKNKIIMHCYASDTEFAKKLLNTFDIFFSFNGIITFKKSDLAKSVLKFLPLEKIIFETDSPYLTPVPYRGKLNKPSLIPLIYEEASKIKNISLDIFKKRIYNNFFSIFKKELI
jgi:TatD DNase family protein